MSITRDFQHEGERLRTSVRALGDGRFAVQVGDRQVEVEAARQADGRVRFQYDGVTFVADAAQVSGAALQVRLGRAGACDAHTYTLAHAASARAGAVAVGTGVIEAPMTGTILEVPVKEGDTVGEGQTVAVLTAMKMEHKLTAGKAGVVRQLTAEVGATVEQGVVLAQIEDE